MCFASTPCSHAVPRSSQSGVKEVIALLVQGLTGEKEVTEKRQLAVSSLRQLEEYIGISHDESQIYLRGPANTT